MGELPGQEGGADPNAVPAQPGNEPGNQPGNEPGNQPGNQPQMVPLAAHIAERRRAAGQIQSLQAELERLKKTATPATQTTEQLSEEEQHIKKWQGKFGIDKQQETIKQLQDEIKALRQSAELGEKAHAQVTAANIRAMNKVESFVTAAFDKDLEGIGFNKEGWESFVASQMTDEDVQECFADPSHAKTIAKRCKEMMAPKINQNKAATAMRVASLPRTPGAGGTPPAPPEPQPVKGKALHARAFDRLQSRVNAEG